MALPAEAIVARRDHLEVAVLAIADGVSEKAQLLGVLGFIHGLPSLDEVLDVLVPVLLNLGIGFVLCPVCSRDARIIIALFQCDPSKPEGNVP